MARPMRDASRKLLADALPPVGGDAAYGFYGAEPIRPRP